MPSSDHRLRIAHVYYHLEVGGIERRLLDLLPRIDRDRFDIRMICTRRRGHLASQLEEKGIPLEVRRCRSNIPMFLSVLPLAALLRRLQLDIVHAHAEDAAQYATSAARLGGVPITIVNFHTVDPPQGPWAVLRERRQSAWRDATIHVSESVHRSYLERVRPVEDNGVVIHNGVDIPHFERRPSDARLGELRREIGIEDRGPVLLSVARLQREKGHPGLLRAFAGIRKKFPDAVLLLAGGGRRFREVEGVIREFSLEPSVRLLGLRSDVSDLYHLADLHLLSSHTEGFSLVVLEAMAAGVPQVLTAVGGNPEAIGDSRAAILVPPGDPEAFGRAAIGILGDPEALGAMRRAAHERVLGYSLEEQVRRTEQVYLDLARRKGVLQSTNRNRSFS